MPELTVTLNHSLIHFLPDDGELYGGMYLASAYANIINCLKIKNKKNFLIQKIFL